MWEKIQTYCFVTVITILIWLYAENENQKIEEFSQEIEFVAPQGRNLVIDPRRPSRRIDVTYKGPTGQLDRIRRLQQAGPIRLTVQELQDDLQGQDPIQQINLKDALSNWPAIAELGVTIEKIDPQIIKVRVERWASKALTIEVAKEGDLQFEGAPQIDPREATVEVPASRLSELGENVKVVARPPLASTDMNVPRTFANVPLSIEGLAAGTDVRITPTTATITLTIKQKSKTSLPLTIPVDLIVPILEQSKYDVRPEKEDSAVLSGITVSGPNKDIDDIDAKKVKLRARVTMSADDLAKAAESKEPFAAPVVIDGAPPGVAVPVQQPMKIKVMRLTAPPVAAPVEAPIGGN